MARKTLFVLIIIGVFSFLAITNPPEEVFLRKIVADYGGAGHGGGQFTVEMVRSMGTSYHKSYYLFSTHTYEFGNVGVSYFGIGSKVFKLNSFVKENSLGGEKGEQVALGREQRTENKE